MSSRCTKNSVRVPDNQPRLCLHKAMTVTQLLRGLVCGCAAFFYERLGTGIKDCYGISDDVETHCKALDNKVAALAAAATTTAEIEATEAATVTTVVHESYERRLAALVSLPYHHPSLHRTMSAVLLLPAAGGVLADIAWLWLVGGVGKRARDES